MQGIKEYFQIQLFCFATFGMDPTSLKRTIVSNFLVWTPTVCLMAMVIHIFIYATQCRTDLNLLTDALSPLWQASLALIKSFYFVWNKDKIVSLVRKIWKMNLKANDEELKILIEENGRDTKFSKFYYICVFATGIMSLISPLLIAIFYYLKGQSFRDNLELPVKAAYFFNTKTHIGYAFAYVWNIIAVHAVMNGNLTIDSLFSWFMHNVAAQFRILNLNFKFDANRVCHDSDEDKVRKQIIFRIKHHRRIIELSQNFNDVYMIIVFIKSTISFIQIAILAYQFARGRELSAQLYHFFFLISVSLQLILYCYGGQRINDESISVAVAIYDSFKWHDLSVKSKKLLLLPIMRAQNPCLLTGVFFVADLSLFVWVFKTAGSFITMLLTLEDKETS
ncbi:odorant receptor 45a-like isoform 2-T2 [Cochliomyia hominivorax]